jgi:hypothetical protein
MAEWVTWSSVRKTPWLSEGGAVGSPMTTGEFFDWQMGGGGGDLGIMARAWKDAGVRWGGSPSV